MLHGTVIFHMVLHYLKFSSGIVYVPTNNNMVSLELE